MAEFDKDSLKRDKVGYKTPWEVLGAFLGLVEKDIAELKLGHFLMSLRQTSAPSLDLAQQTPVKIGKTIFTFADWIAGSEELKILLADKKLINKIVQDAYNLEILPALVKRMGKKSLERGGSGEHMRVSGDPEKLAATNKNKRERFFTRQADELGDKWKQVYNLITARAKIIGHGAVQGFSLDQVLAIQMESKKSTFTSVYMMAEFGTGRVADPGPRRYQSRTATPHKVSPALAALGGDTSWWFTVGKSKIIAKAILKKLGLARRGKSPRTKARLAKEIDTSNLFMFAMGDRGKRSIKPKHAIFDARGVVIQIRNAYKKANEYIARALDEQIVKKVPNWPRGGVVFGSEFYSFLKPPELPQKIG